MTKNDLNIKYVLECKIYTDDDWGLDNNFLDPNRKSNYFENDLYEYTYCDPDDCSYRFRRVFDDKNSILNFMTTMRYCILGNNHWADSAREFMEDRINDVKAHSVTNDFIDSNTEFKLCVYEFATSAKKIKKIIYED